MGRNCPREVQEVDEAVQRTRGQCWGGDDVITGCATPWYRMDKNEIDKCLVCDERFFGPVRYCPFCGTNLADYVSPPFPEPPGRGPIIEDPAISTPTENKVTITALARSEDGANIAQAEWWIGSDPGQGNGKCMDAVEDSFKLSAQYVTTTINVSLFAPGVNQINIRGADVRGIWGPPQIISYTKTLEDSPQKSGPRIKDLTANYTDQNTVTISASAVSEDGVRIAAAECWIGNDPGCGNAKVMYGIFNSPKVAISFSIDTREYKPGDYHISVRSVDVMDKWGDPEVLAFKVEEKKKPDHRASAPIPTPRPRAIPKAVTVCTLILLAIVVSCLAFYANRHDKGIDRDKEGPAKGIARVVASEALKQGTDLSVAIGNLPKLENMLQAARKLQNISPRYQEQVASAENTIGSAHKTRDKYLMAYIGKVGELVRYTPDQVSYALSIVRNGGLTPREKIVSELLTEHVNILQSGAKSNPSKISLDFKKRFASFVD